MAEKRMDDADLNSESAKAGGEYVTRIMGSAGQTEKQRAANYVARGFYMGARFMEKRLGATEKTEGQKAVDSALGGTDG